MTVLSLDLNPKHRNGKNTCLPAAAARRLLINASLQSSLGSWTVLLRFPTSLQGFHEVLSTQVHVKRVGFQQGKNQQGA